MSTLPKEILEFVDETVGDFFSLSKKEQAAYPVELFKSICNGSMGQRPTGLVNAVTSMLAEKNPNLRTDRRSILVPLAGMLSQRAGLSSSVQSAGGYVVGTEVQDLTYLLRRQSVLPGFGIQILTGLSGNIPFPRETGEQSFSWYQEGSTASYGTGASYGQLTLSPHRLVGGTSLSRQLRIQAPSVTEYITTGLSRGALVAFEQATINGNSISGFPTGILATPGAGTVTFAGAASLAKLCDFERQISNANATPTGWVSDPATRNKFRTVVRSANSSRYLWDDANGLRDNVIGYPAYATNVCPANTIVMADWTKVVWGFWGSGVPMEILVDEVSLKRSEQIEVQCSLYGDCGLLQPAAACYSTDSTLQQQQERTINSMTDEQIANPGTGGTKAVMAFQQLPEAHVSVGKIEKWTGEPPPVKRDTPLFPPELLRKMPLEFNGEHEKNAAHFKLYPVRITRTHADGTPSDVVGPFGRILKHGKEYELPGNVGGQLVGDKQAVFLFSGETKEEIEFMEEARRRGVEVHTPAPKPAAVDERPWLKRKKGWVSSVLNEPKPPGFE